MFNKVERQDAARTACKRRVSRRRVVALGPLAKTRNRPPFTKLGPPDAWPTYKSTVAQTSDNTRDVDEAVVVRFHGKRRTHARGPQVEPKNLIGSCPSNEQRVVNLEPN